MLILGVTLALAAAACGADTPSGAAPGRGTTEPVTDQTSDEMSGMDMGDMNMGDADAVPADDVERAVLARGEFVLLDTRPAGHDSVSGTAVIARHPDGTTATTTLSGLLPNEEYTAHVHAAPCSENGGPHYQFEVGGSVLPPNEIHLQFTSDDKGDGFMTAENDSVVGIDAVSFVVHPREFTDNKVACVDFTEDEPGAVAKAVDTWATVDEP